MNHTIDVNIHIHSASVEMDKSLKRMLATLLSLGEDTMTAISVFAAAQRTFNDRMDSAIAGLGEDIGTLNMKIEELQGTPGAITAEDQALLDEIQSRSEAISAKLEAMDALTPPTVPPG